MQKSPPRLSATGICKAACSITSQIYYHKTNGSDNRLKTITGIEPGYRVTNTVAPASSRTCSASVGRVGLAAEIADTCHPPHGTAQHSTQNLPWIKPVKSFKSFKANRLHDGRHSYVHVFIYTLPDISTEPVTYTTLIHRVS